jgi:hypothetical protein
MPVTPIVWNGRLFLFWLKVTKQTSPGKPTLLPAPAAGSNQDLASMPVGDLNSFITTATGVSSSACVTVQAVLCWAEFYNGQWQPTKTSDVNLPTAINVFDPTGNGSFESCRNLFSIVPAQTQSASYLSTEYGIQFALPQDALLLAITGSTGANCPGFILHNTHSLPVRFDDITLRYFRKVTINGFPRFFSGNLQMASLLDQPSLSRSFQPGISPPYTGNYQPGGFAIGYTASTGGTPTAPGTLFQYSWQPRWVEPQPWLADPWGAPFIYEDRRHLFYVVPTEHWTPMWRTEGFGVPGQIATTKAPAATIPPLILRQQVVTPTPAQFLAVSASAGDPAAVQRYIAQDTGLNAALPIQQAISYQGQVITPVGGLAAVLPSPGTDQAGD